ncbi:hypothetical protein T4D_5656 [Trichinella pseudospiralis]|uniref:Transmembrane protein n=1 Tax=Trichinella pseudospiralis TaxID=6337 RepID=A0A0V1FM38_TRIPS|nr:hypothetical protein T4D_5656 [Trichinella pseudospiralis]
MSRNKFQMLKIAACTSSILNLSYCNVAFTCQLCVLCLSVNQQIAVIAAVSVGQFAFYCLSMIAQKFGVNDKHFKLRLNKTNAIIIVIVSACAYSVIVTPVINSCLYLHLYQLLLSVPVLRIVIKKQCLLEKYAVEEVLSSAWLMLLMETRRGFG